MKVKGNDSNVQSNYVSSTKCPHSSTSEPDHEKVNFKELIATGGEVFRVRYTNTWVKASVFVNGQFVPIKTENLPAEFRSIQISEQLECTLLNSYVCAVVLSNGDLKFNLKGRLCGKGGDSMKIDLESEGTASTSGMHEMDDQLTEKMRAFDESIKNHPGKARIYEKIQEWFRKQNMIRVAELGRKRGREASNEEEAVVNLNQGMFEGKGQNRSELLGLLDDLPYCKSIQDAYRKMMLQFMSDFGKQGSTGVVHNFLERLEEFAGGLLTHLSTQERGSHSIEPMEESFSHQPFWDELISIPEFGAMLNFSHIFFQMVKAAGIDDIRKYFKEQVGEHVWAEIDRRREDQKKKYNLNTVFGRAFQEIVKQNSSPLEDWFSRSLNSFLGQVLVLSGSKNVHLEKLITGMEKRSHTIVLYLGDSFFGGSNVTYQYQLIISSNAKVELRKINDIISLKHALNHARVETGGVWVLLPKNKDVCPLPLGEYEVVSYQHRVPGTVIKTISSAVGYCENYVPEPVVALVASASKEFKHLKLKRKAGEEEYFVKFTPTEDQADEFQFSGSSESLDSPSSSELFYADSYLIAGLGAELEGFQDISLRNFSRRIILKNVEVPLSLAVILKNKERIVTALLNEPALLDSLVDNWVQRRLEGVDISLLPEDSTIRTLIEEVLDSCKHSDNRPAEEPFLLELLKEANHRRCCKETNESEKEVSISQVMELLQGAYETANELKGKRAICVVGNTDSGKSTLISYLLKAQLQKVRRPGGDTLLKISQPENRKMPLIGHTLALSQTLYTQGYSLPGASKLAPPYMDDWIVDNPGFWDSRRKEYLLCGSLSMDLAFSNLTSISSVILTIPYQTFISEHLNPLWELIDTVRERFPNIFKMDDPDNRRFYIFMTKSQQVEPHIPGSFQNRLNDLIKQFQTQIDQFVGKPQQHETLQDRLEILSVLLQMYSEGKVIQFDYEDESIPDTLPKQHFPKKIDDVLQPIKYNRALDCVKMHNTFTSQISRSILLWTKIYFQEYLDDFPKAIQELEDSLRLKQKEFNEHREYVEKQRGLKEEIQKHQSELQDLLENENYSAEEIESAIAQLEKQDLSSPGGLASDSRTLTMASGDSSLVDILTTHKHAVASLLHESNNLELLKERRARLKNDIESVEKKVEEDREAVELLSAQILSLEEGSFKDELYKLDIDMEQDLRVGTVRGGIQGSVFQGAIDGIRLLKDNEYEQINQFDPKTYGSPKPNVKLLYFSGLIDKSYQLVSRKNRPVFEDDENETEHLSKGYKAQILDKYRCKLYKRRATAEGNKLLYVFETKWKGDGKAPKVRVEHTIPNRKFNEDEIRRKRAEKKILEERITAATIELEGGEFLPGKKSELIRLEELIEGGEENIKGIKASSDALSKKISYEYLREMKRLQEVRLKKLEEEINKFLQTNEKIEGDIRVNETELDKKRVQKKRLAAAIYDQKDFGEPLSKFIELIDPHQNNGIFPPPSDESKADKSKREKLERFRHRCQEFMQIYGERYEELIRECKKDLGLIELETSSSSGTQAPNLSS